MAVSGNKFYIDDDNREDFVTLCGQLAGLVRSASSDFEDIFQSTQIRKWAKHKPFRYNSQNFDYDPNNPSAAEKARDAARRSVSQGLLLPNAVNAGVNSVTESIYNRTYLGRVFELVKTNQTPDYTYVRPKGGESSPNRMRDFDGYNHAMTTTTFKTTLAIKDVGLMAKAPYHQAFTTEVNRFVGSQVTCTLVRNDSEIDFNDLLPDGAYYYHFCVEVYRGTTISGVKPWKTFVFAENVENLSGGQSQSITIDMDSTFDTSSGGGLCTFLLGVNKFTAGINNAPDDTGKGFFEPRDAGMIPLYNLQVVYYAELDFRQDKGYYIPVGQSAFSSFDLKDFSSPMKYTNSDKVGISLKMKRRSENYLVLGTQSYNAGGQNYYKFKMRVQGGAEVVGTITDASMTSSTTHAQILRGGDEWQTVYLRFDNLLPSSGKEVQFGTLLIAHNNNEFVEIGNVDTSQGCDGSSVRLYVHRN